MHEVLIGSKLADSLNGKANISSPNVEFITRVGTIVTYNNKNVKYASNPAVQFVIATCDGKNWFSGEGPSIPVWEKEYELDFDAALDKLVQNICNYADGNRVKFNLPTLPTGGVLSCVLEIYENIVIRHIRDYLPQSDCIVDRFDVVIIRENGVK